jgi:tRNA1(Val) A37 N6-methylase TrmN6
VKSAYIGEIDQQLGICDHLIGAIRVKQILVINALNGVFPLVLRNKYPDATITCAEIFPFYKHHLRNLGFEVVDWNQMGDHMKFDIVVGNPPYQDKTGNQGSTNSADLYASFVEKSMELTSNYLMM